MKMPASLKIVCVWTMSLMMSHLPNVAVAEAVPVLVPTILIANELNREQAENDLRDLLSRDEVKAQLVANGVSPEEATSRIASLSEPELRQLHMQVEEARAGGDILVTILVVVLIIFLIKRI